jgi:hypothetical protein
MSVLAPIVVWDASWALTLSTATPYRGANMPILSTWRIGVSPEPGRRDWSRSLQGVHIMRAHSERERTYTDHHTPRVIQVDQAHSYSSRSPSPQRSRSRSYSPTRCIVSDSPSHVGIDDEPTPMAVRQVEIVETGVLSATFNVPGRSNIPSDQGDHKVLIGSLDFPISPEWICIPRKDESVFLRVGLKQQVFIIQTDSLPIVQNCQFKPVYFPPGRSQRVYR